MTHQATVSFPRWFVALTVALGISNFVVFGWVSLFDPSIAFFELGAGDGRFPAQFFAIRHIVFAGPLIAGLVTRNVSLLRAMYGMFLAMAVLDIAVLLANGYFIPIIGELSLLATLAVSIPGFIGSTSLGLLHLRSYATS